LDIIGFPPPSDGIDPTKFRSTDPVIESRIIFSSGTYKLNTKNLPPGNYLIEYVFTNSAGARDTLTKTLKVSAAPKAVIAIDKACVDNQNIVFIDNATIPNNPFGDQIVTWDWVFGNGRRNVGQRFPEDRYETSGLYSMTLEVETNEGCKHDTVGTITVGKPPKVDFDVTKICSGDFTTFTDKSTPFLNNIVAYSWDFDDLDTLGFGAKNKNVLPPFNHGGKTGGTYNNPTHKYSTFRIYNVKLNLLTDDGCTADTTKRIYILDYGAPVPTNAYLETFEGGSGQQQLAIWCA
jgi:hypothetical protein